MNFISAFDELDKLYESVDIDQLKEAIDEEVVEEAEEAAEDPAEEAAEEAEEEAEEVAEEEVVNKPIVLECVKCGALVIKDESEVTIDEDSDLANVGEECAYCEESEGFKAIGTFEPYVVETVDDEVAEETVAEVIDADIVEDDTVVEESIEEGIFDKKKKVDTSASEKESKVTYTIYDEYGTKQFSHTFTELPGKMDAAQQLKNLLKDSYPNVYKLCKNNRDWMYERTSVPASSFDTKRGRNYFVSELYL